MKLVIAIVQDEYSSKVIRGLTAKDYRTTKLSSTGGFLKYGNTTLLMGVQSEDVDKVIDIIRKECKGKKVNNGGEEVDVGAANIFVLNMKEFMKI